MYSIVYTKNREITNELSLIITGKTSIFFG